jgi:hypothetical protein
MALILLSELMMDNAVNTLPIAHPGNREQARSGKASQAVHGASKNGLLTRSEKQIRFSSWLVATYCFHEKYPEEIGKKIS